MDSTSSVDRPHMDDLRTMSYNRVTIPTDLKNTICSQIADSTESLPLWSKNEYDGAHDNPSAQKVTDSSQIATPKLEKSDPMETLPLDQQKTAQADELDAHTGAGAGDSSVKGGADNRPGTLRRLTTKIKKTMSGSGGPNGEHKKLSSPSRATRS